MVVARAGLGTIPFAGSAAVEILNEIVGNPLEKRQREWMAEVADALVWLEENRGLALDDLKDNSSFHDLVTEILQRVSTDTDSAKLTALRHLLLNAALASSTR
ncbi:hypothetical protein [Nitrosomonas sp. Is37]|uniref:hypothetical protein n=1 Tax=Nitrosomonas sp. Is37 TaxID=3080535 RepID=UPI00294B0DEA|nr:hypothetical protein [Nitrosomonas sp. Is37]MDV6345034.1 hypothetical protein [Nitrosomonas sp. Is37]